MSARPTVAPTNDLNTELEDVPGGSTNRGSVNLMKNAPTVHGIVNVSARHSQQDPRRGWLRSEMSMKKWTIPVRPRQVIVSDNMYVVCLRLKKWWVLS